MIPGHTTRAPPVGFELATDGVKFQLAEAVQKHDEIFTKDSLFSLDRIGPGGNADEFYAIAYLDKTSTTA